MPLDERTRLTGVVGNQRVRSEEPEAGGEFQLHGLSGGLPQSVRQRHPEWMRHERVEGFHRGSPFFSRELKCFRTERVFGKGDESWASIPDGIDRRGIQLGKLLAVKERGPRRLAIAVRQIQTRPMAEILRVQPNDRDPARFHLSGDHIGVLIVGIGNDEDQATAVWGRIGSSHFYQPSGVGHWRPFSAPTARATRKLPLAARPRLQRTPHAAGIRQSIGPHWLPKGPFLIIFSSCFRAFSASLSRRSM